MRGDNVTSTSACALARRTLVACLAALTLLALLPGASAHVDTAHGTVTVHATTVSPATERIDACSFVVKGSGLTDSGGELVLVAMEGNQSGTETLRSAWTGQLESSVPTYRFSSTFVATAGEYRVWLGVGTESEQGQPAHATYTPLIVVNCGGSYLACPTGLSAVSLATGGVQLQWVGSTAAESYAVYRSSAADPIARLTLLPSTATSYTDTGTTPGVTYTYRVNAEAGLQESLKCSEAQATARGLGGAATTTQAEDAPPAGDASGGAAGALAAALGVGAIAMMRRL
jgi:hypothetical protein